jgi:hypothetical protein
MNTELLIKTKHYIQANPEELAMQSWDCGSAACIGGHACRLAGKPITMLMMGRYTQLHHCRTVLGLTLEQARDLFFLDSWPTDLRYRYESAEEEGRAAEVAAERIDRFINQYSVVVN